MAVIGEAASPRACIVGVLESRPDVVALDEHLEGGSGLEVLRAVRQVAPEIAFVVFSNNSGPLYRKRFVSEGAHEFLDKSIEFDRLASSVVQASIRPA